MRLHQTILAALPLLSSAAALATPASATVTTSMPAAGEAPTDLHLAVTTVNADDPEMALVDSAGNTHPLVTASAINDGGDPSDHSTRYHFVLTPSAPLAPGTYSVTSSVWGSEPFALTLVADLASGQLSGAAALLESSVEREIYEYYPSDCGTVDPCEEGTTATYVWSLPASPGNGWYALAVDRETGRFGGAMALSSEGDSLESIFYAADRDDIARICPTLKVVDPFGVVQAEVDADCVLTRGASAGCATRPGAPDPALGVGLLLAGAAVVTWRRRPHGGR